MKTEFKQNCSQKYCLLLRLYCLFLSFIALCGAVTLGANGFKLQAAWLGVLSGIILLIFLGLPIYSGRISYTQTSGGIRIERGSLVKKTIVINRRDIKSSQLSRTFMERRLGICTLSFSSPSGKISLKGIDFNDGKRLKYLLCEGSDLFE